MWPNSQETVQCPLPGWLKKISSEKLENPYDDVIDEVQY